MSTKPSVVSGLISIEEFCRRYSISRSAFYREVREGRLTAVKRGRLTFIDSGEACRWSSALPKLQLMPGIGKAA